MSNMPSNRSLHPNNAKAIRPRNSNLELYRIIVMLLIVAHHYVVNSGLIQAIQESNDFLNSSVMLVFGAWGKTGINCFVLITGYFMCTSVFSPGKLVKLYLQITLYGLIIYGIFCITGHETFSVIGILKTFWPVRSISDDFVSCFLLFYLFIPILNILVKSMDKRMHKYLVILLVSAFSILPSVPTVRITFNYVTWFMALYMVASYIRMYGLFPGVNHRQWGWLAISTLLIGSISVLGLEFIYCYRYIDMFIPHFFIADSNKFLSLAIAVSSFMYFKDLKIPHSRLINSIGLATFGVLLIHTNSDAMRQWLWKETVDCIGHFGDSVLWTLGYAAMSVVGIFVICAGIDWFRGRFIEPVLLKCVNKVSSKIRSLMSLKKSIS